MKQIKTLFAVLATAFMLGGCAAASVVDAAATVASTAIKVGSTVVETTVDVAKGAVKAVSGSSEKQP